MSWWSDEEDWADEHPDITRCSRIRIGGTEMGHRGKGMG